MSVHCLDLMVRFPRQKLVIGVGSSLLAQEEQHLASAVSLPRSMLSSILVSQKCVR